MLKKPYKHNRSFLFCFVITAAWFAIIFFTVVTTSKISRTYLWEQSATIFFNPNHNNSIYGELNGINTIIYVYLVICVSAITTHFFIFKIFIPRIPVNALLVLKQVTCSALCILIFLQIIGQTSYFAFRYNNVAGKPVNERYPYPFKTFHDLGSYFQRIFPGKHSAELISDLNISQDPGMFIHRAIAYYLYPIDIRNIRREPYDSIVVIEKYNASQNIPGNFKILGNFNNEYFLAVKPGSKE